MTMVLKMQVISAGEFKAKCLKLMDLVAQTHEEYTITKRGKPIARIVPIESNENPFGFLKGAIDIKDDIVSCDSNETWEADQ